jgi:hypothetical protein
MPCCPRWRGGREESGRWSDFSFDDCQYSKYVWDWNAWVWKSILRGVESLTAGFLPRLRLDPTMVCRFQGGLSAKTELWKQPGRCDGKEAPVNAVWGRSPGYGTWSRVATPQYLTRSIPSLQSSILGLSTILNLANSLIYDLLTDLVIPDSIHSKPRLLDITMRNSS